MTTTELRDARFMRSLLAASDDCIKIIDLDGRLDFMSEGGQRTMEVSDFNALRGCPWPDFWQGEGNRDAIASIAAARSGRSSRFQGAADTAAGNPRYWDVQVSPVFGSDGRVESILSVSRDITTLKESENRQHLLALELKHRIKNTIAMIQAVANQTLRGGKEIEAAKLAFDARLAALSAAQDLLTQSAWSRARLGQLVAAALAPHGQTRFRIEGPELELSSKCALAMALTLHELATNAAKYGALRQDEGEVEVTWTQDAGVFRFQWRESGGPPVTPPTRSGFGSRMIERALAGYFSGTAAISYPSTGVEFTLQAPAEALLAE